VWCQDSATTTSSETTPTPEGKNPYMHHQGQQLLLACPEEASSADQLKKNACWQAYIISNGDMMLNETSNDNFAKCDHKIKQFQ